MRREAPPERRARMPEKPPHGFDFYPYA
jgi:hypothetical protein